MFRVTLSPGLEQKALLWTPQRRIEMAIKLEMWAHQLRLSVRVYHADHRVPPRPRLKWIGPRRSKLN